MLSSYFFTFIILFTLTLFAVPMGCVLLWRRCVYIGDGLSHASVLSISVAGALSISFSGLSFLYISLAVCVLVIIMIYWFEKSSDIYVSTNIITSFVVVLAMLIQHIHSILCCSSKIHAHNNHDHCEYFSDFVISGNLDSITNQDLFIVLFFGTISLICIFANLRNIMLVSFNRDIAKILGVKVMLIDVLFFVSSALFINVATRAIGLLLVSSIFVFPALMSQWISKSPIKMIFNSMIIGVLSNLIGVGIWKITNIPFAIVVALFNGLLLFATYIYLKHKNKIKAH